VCGSIDDGGIRALVPLTESFILNGDRGYCAGFVATSGTASPTYLKATPEHLTLQARPTTFAATSNVSFSSIQLPASHNR
jgi:hypothetical protein